MSWPNSCGWSCRGPWWPSDVTPPCWCQWFVSLSVKRRSIDGWSTVRNRRDSSHRGDLRDGRTKCSRWEERRSTGQVVWLLSNSTLPFLLKLFFSSSLPCNFSSHLSHNSSVVKWLSCFLKYCTVTYSSWTEEQFLKSLGSLSCRCWRVQWAPALRAPSQWQGRLIKCGLFVFWK